MKKIEVGLKNIFLKILLFFNKKTNSNNKPVFNESSKILFVRLNRIGDALVSTALIHEIKKNIHCKISVLADKKNFFVFNNNPDIDEIIIFQKGFSNFRKIVKRLNENNFDAAVDLHTDVSTTVSFLISFLKIPFKFGLEKENKILFTHTIKCLDVKTNHVIDRLLQLNSLFNINLNSHSANVVYNATDKSLKTVTTYLTRKFSQNKFLLGINISAGSQARFWGIEKFNDLLNFISGYDINYLLLSSTRDLKYAMEMRIEKEKIYYTPDFDEFAAMISKIDMLFSPDTATIHLASAFKKPVFGIYVNYNTDEMIWSPYKSDFDCVITKEPTLFNVTSEEVITKFKLFLEKYI